MHSRRSFLRKASTVAGAVGLSCARKAPGGDPLDVWTPPEGPGDPPFDATSFPQGVMAGDATADAAVLWTRYAGTLPLQARVFEDGGGAPGALAHEAEVVPSATGVVHHDATGLLPGKWYWYVFQVHEGETLYGRSEYGRFRTALAPSSLEPVRFAVTCCTHQRARPFAALIDAAGRDDLDCFFHLGDHVYCDGAKTPDDYRAKYHLNWSSEGMLALHSSTGMYLTWDDHEVTNDWDVDRITPSHLVTAREAFFEHRAVRRDPDHPDRIWRSFRWGLTAEFFVLDVRGERLQSTKNTGRGVLVSPAQLEWLISGLKSSPARLKFVFSPQPIMRCSEVNAGWADFEPQRSQLLSSISDVHGVWFVSGDLHLGACGFADPPGRPYSHIRDVLAGPGGNGPNYTFQDLKEPQFDFATTDHNYTVFHCDPVAGTVDVTYVNGQGRQLFHRQYASSGAFCSVQGEIQKKYLALGGLDGFLGACLTPDQPTADGAGRFAHFEGGSIYFHPSTGAHEVHGLIRQKWQALASEAGALGYPTTDELPGANGTARYNLFQNGGVFFRADVGVHAVAGDIYRCWESLGRANGKLGLPVSDEEPIGEGKVSRFQGGHIYWSAATLAHEVHGQILERFLVEGGIGRFGFPTTGVTATPTGNRCDFQRGAILYDSATGTTSVL